ncbi:hypothetical protein WJX79_002005 [Trebouxia sp. C0005]
MCSSAVIHVQDFGSGYLLCEYFQDTDTLGIALTPRQRFAEWQNWLPVWAMSNEGMSVMVGDLSHEDPATLSRLPFGHSQMSSFSRGGWTLACRIWSMMLEDLDPTSKQQAVRALISHGSPTGGGALRYWSASREPCRSPAL